MYEGLLELGITVFLGRVGKRRGWGPRWSRHVSCSDDAENGGAGGRGKYACGTGSLLIMLCTELARRWHP